MFCGLRILQCTRELDKNNLRSQEHVGNGDDVFSACVEVSDVYLFSFHRIARRAEVVEGQISRASWIQAVELEQQFKQKRPSDREVIGGPRGAPACPGLPQRGTPRMGMVR